ncbi:MAG: PilZ domain-containing protein [Dongiaceae bacterium]
MRVLAFASQKSGAGKTTLAGHVAIQAQRAGMTPVVLVDVDPDASLTDWFALREEEDDAITVARSSLAGLPTKLQELRADGVELVVIDTPPALHHSIDEPIIAADLVAIPTRPCAHDLAAAGATVEMVQSHGKPFVFVVNGATPDGELTPEVVMALAQHGTVATVTIPRSLAVLECMLDGRTVVELPDNPAASSEVARLWDYLSKRLERSGLTAPDTAPQPTALAGIKVVATEAADADSEAEAEAESEPAPRPAAAAIADVQPPPVPLAALAEPAPTPTAAANPEALRRYPRFKYEQPAVLIVGDGRIDCVVHDISAGGALVAIDRPLGVGDTVTLALDSIGKLPAEVRHSDGGRAGLRFIIDPKQQLFLVKHLSAVIAAASTTVQGPEIRAGA